MSQALTQHIASVVVIDDTPDLRLLLRMVLELSDRYTVVGEAGDGAAGIEIVRVWQPDLVLLDLAMPVMDGLEALPGIRDACPHAEVVVLSGFEADRMAGQALERGAAGYLQKGTSPDDIVRALDDILGRSEGAHEVAFVVPKPATAPDEVEALRTAFVTAAHELRTPATVLIGLANMLIRRRSQLDPARIDELLDAVIRQTRVLDRITSDMLTSAQASRGGLAAHVEPTDLVPLLRAAALSMAEHATVAVEAPSTIEVLADPVRVQQMLTNLLSNAVKYGAAPMGIVAVARAGRAVVRVDDSGDGVPAAFQPRLFEQYSRARESRAAGTGLGLYVVKALAEAQGGTAWHEGRSGGGASFFFSLPLA
jgi:signal transduction histidine kinase